MLGLTISNDLTWTNHVNQVLSNLRSANGLLCRLAAHVRRQDLLPVVHGLLLSRIRYGLAVYGRVRLEESEPTNALMLALQKETNHALRLVCGKHMKDRVKIESLLATTGIKSINQIAAESQLRELWRTLNYNLPLNDLLPRRDDFKTRCTRSSGLNLLQVSRRDQFQGRIARLWNSLPEEVRSKELSKGQVLNLIGSFVGNLPT